MATSPSMTPTSNNIDEKYHFFRQHVGKEFVIRKTESENQKANIFIIGLQGELFVRIKKLICGLVSLQMRGIVSTNGVFGL